MTHLPESIKMILSALAVENAGDYLSLADKKANLERVLSSIEQEQSSKPAAQAGAAEDRSTLPDANPKSKIKTGN